jgi:hypothetical protein
MNFDSRPEWYEQGQSLRHVIIKAQTYYDEYIAIHGNKPLAHAPAPTPVLAPALVPARQPRPCQPNPTSPPPPNNSPPVNCGPIPSEIQSLKNHLKTVCNQSNELAALSREYCNTCPLHHNPRHNLINCSKLSNICQELGIFHKFNSVQEDLGLTSMLPKAN